jgi:hypothetical protein
MIDTRIDNQGAVSALAIRKGATLAIPLEIDADLTGASIAARVYDSAGATVVTFTVAITDAPNGKALLSLTAAQTRALLPGHELGEDTSLSWGVTLVDSLGARLPLLSGPVAVRPELSP